MFVFLMQQQGRSPEAAARELEEQGMASDRVAAVLGWHRDRVEQNELLTPPPGVPELRYLQEAQLRIWDAGQNPEVDLFWPVLKPVLTDGMGAEAVESVDIATNLIRAKLGSPHSFGSTRRGLVVGYVQSGKTANYTALLAKAADAGYRGFIVLSGIHNALRLQTQQRLEKDLITPANAAHAGKHGAPTWHSLTQVSPDRDFGPIPNGVGLLSATELRLLAVVKKNPSRLRHLRDWLREIPAPTRKRCPFLVIDDEADQATPNTGRAGAQASVINLLLRQVFALLPTSTYVGYTATPFANVLIDPRPPDARSVDEDGNPLARDFYPRDFIISLPRPAGYFGAEALFGSPEADDAGESDDGYDLIRTVSEDEVAALRPPTNGEERAYFEPPVTEALRDAIRWFLLSTAVRRLRGHERFHSSMLIHTTQYAATHFKQADAVRAFLAAMGQRLHLGDANEVADLEKRYVSELDRFVPDGGVMPPVEEVLSTVPDVLANVKVLVDNGSSDDRLDYTATEIVDGVETRIPQTVIAVGGQTLSRGLTLEGLIVSYFLRTATTYDALLQMGRWFGFRPGYGDLARVWMPNELASNFRFLSGVESEIREDIARYSMDGLTPEIAGVRIRRHPAMAITSPLKMQHVRSAEISYAGERRQTFMFDRLDGEALRNNLRATRILLDNAASAAPVWKPNAQRWVFEAVPGGDIEDFLTGYHFHPHHDDLRARAILDFLERWDAAGFPISWNVAVIGSSSTRHRLPDGGEIDLGTIDLGLDADVGLLNRSRLSRDPREGPMANIKSLMSTRDRVVDLRGMEPGEASGRDAELARLRASKAPGVGLLAIYPIAKDSQPLTKAQVRAGSRQNLDAVEHVVGLGLVFPDPPPGSPTRLLTSAFVQVDLSRAGEQLIEQDEDEWDRAGEEVSAQDEDNPGTEDGPA